MAILSKEQLIEKLRAVVGDTPDDNGVSLLEDVVDTFDDVQEKINDKTDWKAKCEETDRKWREKYTNRFYSGKDDDDDPGIRKDDIGESLTFDNLFKEE